MTQADDQNQPGAGSGLSRAADRGVTESTTKQDYCRQVVDFLDALATLTEPLDQLTLDASMPVTLLGTEQNLAVLQGALDLFAVRYIDGQARGTRFPLGRVELGEVISGLPLEMCEAHQLALVAVGVADTRVACDLPLQELQADHLAAVADRLFAGLTKPLAVQRSHQQRRLLSPGSHVDLYEGDTILAASRRPLWLISEEAAIFSLHGQHPVTAARVLLTHHLWLDVCAATACELATSEQIADRGELLTALHTFLADYVLLLDARLNDQEQKDRHRLLAHEQNSEYALIAALKSMARTVGDTHVPDDTTTYSSNLLVRTLRCIAQPLHITIVEPELEKDGLNHLSELDAIATVSGIQTRPVMLQGEWWRKDSGPLLAYTEAEHAPVALLPSAKGYQMVDLRTEQRLRVDEDLAASLNAEAVMLYRIFPRKIGGLRGLISFIGEYLWHDLRIIMALGMVGGIIAAITPLLIGVLIESVIPRADIGQHVQLIVGLIVLTIGSQVFEIVEGVTLLRLSGRADMHLQAAVFDRLMRLPARFFRQYTSGDLSDRSMGIHEIRSILTGSTISSILGVLFSLFSLAILFYYSITLALLGLLLVAVSLGVTAVLAKRQLAAERDAIAQQGQVESFTIQLLSGVSKVRVAAADVRAYARWLTSFSTQKGHFVKTQALENTQYVFHSFFPIFASVCIYLAAVTVMQGQGLTVGAFIAFSAAFGQLLGAMTGLSHAVTDALRIIPIYERIKPVLETEVETTLRHGSVHVTGDIELNHVNFGYDPDAALILDDLCLHIHSGEFVAIVGPSGSGKSTLLRMLLGFEQPQQGEVLFDGVPASHLDMATVRRQMGVVLQSGQLTSGSIFTNIVGTSKLTQEDAHRAAAQVGLDDDIASMPMGMHTVITEGVNTLSGGQRQRLMIARALVREPALLLLDEATSALDNRTQEIVTNTLAALDATRIVIAHRLSTIQMADRIIVLDQGRVKQQGSYQQLISAPGAFRDLAERQLM